MSEDEILDYLPMSQSWAVEWGDRVFWYDAFLSHRRYDGSERIRRILQEKFGLHVFHDEDADARDLKVASELAVALNNSRFVVACVGENYDSAYCRAEYLPALDIEKQADGTKVLVAEMKKIAPVPPELTSHTRFTLSEPIDESDPELASLADYLRAGNLLPFDIREETEGNSLFDEVVEARVMDRSREVLGQPQRDDDGPKTDLIERVLAVIVSESLETSGCILNLMYLRNYICGGHVDWTSTPDETLRYIRDVALSFAVSGNTDNRANAMMVLTCLGRLGRMPEIRADVLKFVRRECTGGLARPAEAGIVGEALRWYRELWPQLTEREVKAVELACLCVPREVQYAAPPELIASLPEVIRVRLFPVAGLRTEVLPLRERLGLINRRVKYIIERETSSESKPGFRSELELEFRELTGLIFKHGEAVDHGADEKDIYQKVVQIIGSATRSSKVNRGLPLLYVGEFIADLVLNPLLICYRQKALWKSARKVYMDVCEVISRFSTLAAEVPQYLKWLELAQSGGDVSQGIQGEAFWKISRDSSRIDNGREEAFIRLSYPELTFGENYVKPTEIAQWLSDRIERLGTLYRDSAIGSVSGLFGDKYIQVNKRGNYVFDKSVLAELRKVSTGRAKWNSRKQCWMKLEPSREKD